MSNHDKTPKSRKRILKDIFLEEVSVCDHPMNQPSKVAILKRAGYDDSSMADPTTPLVKRIALTSMTAGHGHSIITDFDGGERQVGITSYQHEHEHDWVMDEAGNIILAEADGHSHAIGVLIQKHADDISDILPEGGPLADLLRMGVKPASDSEKVVKMTDNEKKAAELATSELNKAVSERDANQKRAERLDMIVKLSPEMRKHFDEQSDAGKDEFLATSDEDRKAIVKNAKNADPVVYTATDGRTFRKSADENFVAEVKRNDSLQKQLADADTLQKRSSIEKRAEAELGHMTGELSPKADLLEAIETLPTEKREPVMAMLSASDAGVAKAMERIGSTNATAADNGAEAQLEAMAKRISIDEKISEADAYVKATESKDGQKLYAEMRAGQ